MSKQPKNLFMSSSNLKVLTSYDHVVTKLGGTVELGRRLQTTSSAICNWKRERGVFPARYYFAIQWALEDMGYSASPTLFSFKLLQRKPPPPQRQLEKPEISTHG